MCVGVCVMRYQGYAYQHGYFVNDLARVHSENTCMQGICRIVSVFVFECVTSNFVLVGQRRTEIETLGRWHRVVKPHTHARSLMQISSTSPVE